MNNLTADSVAELFSAAVTLAKNGERVSPRGFATREVMNVSVNLAQPRARLLCVPPARVLNPAFAVAETVWILSGTDDPWIFDYNSRLKRAESPPCRPLRSFRFRHRLLWRCPTAVRLPIIPSGQVRRHVGTHGSVRQAGLGDVCLDAIPVI
jgi:hypothetical protein